MLELYRSLLKSNDLDVQYSIVAEMQRLRGTNTAFLTILKNNDHKDRYALVQRIVNSKIDVYERQPQRK